MIYRAIDCSYRDFATFVLDNYNRVYRMWQYKKSWTPWEEKNCTELDTNFVDDKCNFIVIREAIELPDGDILLGVQYVYFNEGDDLDKDQKDVSIYYYKLSEISLAYIPSDQFDYKENEE